MGVGEGAIKLPFYDFSFVAHWSTSQLGSVYRTNVLKQINFIKL